MNEVSRQMAEKYIGDGLRQKTYTTGPIGNKKTVKNNGELSMYYSRDHHPADRKSVV